MRRYVLLALLSLQVLGCNSQKNKAVEQVPVSSVPDTTQPQVSIRVNKTYDDKGNLVQYDSAYSYYYSSPGGRIKQLSSDSFYSQFRTRFHSRYDDWLDSSLEPIFFSDSLFKYDFLNSDYFNKRYELNRKRFNDLFREMDSLKTDMLKHYFPDGTMKKNLK